MDRFRIVQGTLPPAIRAQLLDAAAEGYWGDDRAWPPTAIGVLVVADMSSARGAQVAGDLRHRDWCELKPQGPFTLFRAEQVGADTCFSNEALAILLVPPTDGGRGNVIACTEEGDCFLWLQVHRVSVGSA